MCLRLIQTWIMQYGCILQRLTPSVKAQGQRVFDVRINNQVVLPNLDIYKLVGGPFFAYDWHFTLVNLTGSSLTIDFEAKIGPPLICGLEVYALLTADVTTNVTEGELYSEPRQSQLWIRNIKAFEILKFLGACSGAMLKSVQMKVAMSQAIICQV